MWPDLMRNLVVNVTNPQSTEMMKEASLEAIGYICQDIVSHYAHHTHFSRCRIQWYISVTYVYETVCISRSRTCLPHRVMRF